MNEKKERAYSMSKKMFSTLTTSAQFQLTNHSSEKYLTTETLL